MINYVQSFRINGEKFGIEKTKVGFYVWRGGCGLKEFLTMQEARIYIYQRSLGQLMNEIDNTQRKLQSLKTLYEQLNPEVGDEFVLGRFLE